MARDGFGDMAVSNAIGSNVFDINLGLGFPFIIRIISDKGQPFSVLNGDERVSQLYIDFSDNPLFYCIIFVMQFLLKSLRLILKGLKRNIYKVYENLS